MSMLLACSPAVANPCKLPVMCLHYAILYIKARVAYLPQNISTYICYHGGFLLDYYSYLSASKYNLRCY